MRRILLEITDYDPVASEEWSESRPALLIAPDILLSVCQSDIEFYYFDEAIADDVEVISSRKSNKSASIETKGIERFKLEELAELKIADLAGLLR